MSLIKIIFFYLLTFNLIIANERVRNYSACLDSLYTEITTLNADVNMTKAFLVLKNDKIIYEKYANGLTVNKKHILWSAAKTITAMLVGAANNQGILDVESRVKDFYPAIKSNDLTIRHLLTMTSGIDFTETYENGAFNSDVVALLYGVGKNNVPEYVLSLDQKYSPGKYFNYSTGDTNVLMGILKQKLSHSDYAKLPWKLLFDPMGIESATWETDGSGTYAGGSYLYLTARDLAKFAILLKNNGKWKNKTIFTKEWKEFMISPNNAFTDFQKMPPNDKPSYGGQIWLNKPIPEIKKTAFHPNIPHDTYFFLGHDGQTIFIFPKENLIIMRLAFDSKKHLFSRDKYITSAYECMK